MKWLEDILNSEVEDKMEAIKQELPKHFMPKDKWNEVNEELKQLKETVDERDKQLTELKKQAKDNEELTSKIAELQEQNKAAADEFETRLASQRFNFAVEREVSAHQAKNVRAVKALLDLDKVKMDGDKLLGISEQLEELKKSEPYLFGANLKGREPHPDNTPPPPQKNPWKKDQINLTEQGRILRDDPELAERLKAAAGT